MKLLRKLQDIQKRTKINHWIVFFALIYVVLVIKFLTIKSNVDSVFFAGYSIAVSFYFLSRFVFSFFHTPSSDRLSKDYYPTVSIGIPSKNEGLHIRDTILSIAKSDYPKDKFNIIAVNDGSDDNTLEEMLKGKELAAEIGVKVEVVDWKINKGKRDGMAECINRSTSELVMFVDSDSYILPNTINELAKYFKKSEVGAVAAHAYVANAYKNILTKMQSARYFIAFKTYKASESIFSNVTCCSGCCSAYRREYLLPFLDKWLGQRFLGVNCTYGDDRSLTNLLLKAGYKTLYSPSAVCYTFVPETFEQFMKQQLRWKKSWFRESLLASTFMWKRNPLMSSSFYLGFLLPLLGPIVVIRAMVWYPITHHSFPLYYITGLILMSLIFGIYYHIKSDDKYWKYGTFFSLFYTLVLMWQLPYAILTIRDSRWGTR
jgi:hyaluronan synthase